MARESEGAGHGVRSRSDWEQLVSEYEASGLTRKAFCAARSVAVTSLDYWRGKLRAKAPAAGFIEVAPVGRSAAWDVELELGGGMVLRLRR